MGRRSIAGCVGVMAVLALATGSAASADTAAVTLTMPAPGRFQLPASNGYHLEAFSHAAGQGQPSQVYLIARKGRSYAAYLAGAKVTPTSLEADFGSLGRVAVSYHPTGKVLVAEQCGGPVTYRAGYYEGTIEFHGEGGFTDVTAGWATGKLRDEGCRYTWEGVGGYHGAIVSVFSWQEGHEFSFQAYKNRPDGRANFGATLLEASGDVAIVRSTETRAPASALSYDNGPDVVIDPPAPFSGTARLHERRRRADDWSGNLTVDFPGHADVSLVTEPMWADLTRHAQLREGER